MVLGSKIEGKLSRLGHFFASFFQAHFCIDFLYFSMFFSIAVNFATTLFLMQNTVFSCLVLTCALCQNALDIIETYIQHGTKIYIKMRQKTDQKVSKIYLFHDSLRWRLPRHHFHAFRSDLDLHFGCLGHPKASKIESKIQAKNLSKIDAFLEPLKPRMP